jgi:hypothetical protein
MKRKKRKGKTKGKRINGFSKERAKMGKRDGFEDL